jgi:L-aminopeptidase/D-esterase-like protein
MRWLDEGHGQWFQHPTDAVPIVPAAVLIDLWVAAKPSIRPGAECGYRAAAAASRARVADGSVGAGAGATVGKLTGLDRAMKGGIGSAAVTLPDGLGLPRSPRSTRWRHRRSGERCGRRGARADDGSLRDVRKLLRSGAPLQRTRVAGNTTLGVVATNAHLTKAEANRVRADGRCRDRARRDARAYDGRRRHGLRARDRSGTGAPTRARSAPLRRRSWRMRLSAR